VDGKQNYHDTIKISVPTFWQKSYPHINKIKGLAPMHSAGMSNMG
jgi:hypothetical protein